MKNLGDRMKSYEGAYETSMIGRLPVIIRVDGKRFSKLTKRIKAEKPFDDRFSAAMTSAMFKTAQDIEGCVIGFTQSDEITFVVRNDQSLESEPWFGNRVQKITSITASMCTAHFLNAIGDDVGHAYFDARTFVVPNIIEAGNCLVWRQNDAVKNIISAACYYESAKAIGKKTARKKMHGLNQKQQQEMLFQETGINWNDYPVKYKRGIACYKIKNTLQIDGQEIERSSWIVDENIPNFVGTDFLQSILGE